MAYFKIKIYVTKVWKSKISDDSLLAFSVAFILAYFVFSLVAVFMEKFSDQNHLLWKFSKKVGKVHFVQQNLHLRNFSPQPISINLICPSEKFVLDPTNFNRGLCFHEDVRKTKSPLFRMFSKKLNFFTNHNMIEAIALNCTKTKGPTIKMNKTNFEVHGLKINLCLFTLI